MSKLVQTWKTEPVVWLNLVEAIVVLGVAFGLSLSEGQTLAIYGVAKAVLTPVARASVYPSEHVIAD